MTRTGVLLVTLGGPRTRDEVPVFLERFIGRELSPPALRAVVERYERIGGCSPLDTITERQAAALEGLLDDGTLCRAAFRHSDPSIEAQIAALRDIGVGRLVLLVLSPFFASVTTGNYLAHAKQVLADSGWGVEVLFVHSWHAEPLFVTAWSERIAREAFLADPRWLFSAHSLPERLAAEPYRGQIETACAAIASRLSLGRWTLGWQSVPGGAREPWFGPTVEEVLDGLARDDVAKPVVQVPVGFTADHIETLYDIDVLHREHAAKLGLPWRRVSSLNDGPAFIRALAQVLAGALVRPERHRP
jgi:ferrochelatase